MKGVFLINDDELLQQLQNASILKKDEFIFHNNLESIQQSIEDKCIDAWVLSDRFFDFLGLCEYIEEINERRHENTQIIVLLSNHHDARKNEQYVRFFLTHHIKYIVPGCSSALIVGKIFELIRGEGSKKNGNKNVVLFMGSTPNIGTTVVSFGTSFQIAKQTDKEIAYICLNLKSSKIHRYLGIDQPFTTLDGIRAEIKSHGLTEERMKQYCEKLKDQPNLYVLFGNMIREQAEYYTMDDIDYLLTILSATFDLCIVEVNAYWDNAATISSLMYADTKIILSTTKLVDFQEDLNRWLKSLSPVFDIEPHHFDLFITQTHSNFKSNGFRIRDVRKETEMNVIGHLSKLEHMDEWLNQGRIVDLLNSEPKLYESLSDVVHMVMKLYDLEMNHPQLNTGWFQRLERKLLI